MECAEDDLILSSSSNSDDDNPDYHLDTVPNFSDKQFKWHFRMAPNQFESLCVELHEHYDPRDSPMAFDKVLLIGIWYFANLECMR